MGQLIDSPSNVGSPMVDTSYLDLDQNLSYAPLSRVTLFHFQYKYQLEHGSKLVSLRLWPDFEQS